MKAPMRAGRAHKRDLFAELSEGMTAWRKPGKELAGTLAPRAGRGRRAKRPAVIVSAERYNRERPDLIIMAVTSQARPAGGFGEVRAKNWQVAGLIKPSVIKPVVTTIEQTLVLRRLGRLEEHDQTALKRAIGTIIG